MADLVNSLANFLSDAAILAVSAIVFALLGGGIALATNWLWFRRWSQRSAFEDKLANTAHASLLGLSAFVLALLITNGVSSLARTDEMVRLEGVAVYRLNRELARSARRLTTPDRLSSPIPTMSPATNGRVSQPCRTLSRRSFKRISTIFGARSARFSGAWTRRTPLGAILQRT